MRVLRRFETARPVLVVNPFGIGDVLFTTPLLRALRGAFPKSPIGYLCNRRTERILRHNRHIEKLFIYEKDEFKDLWNHRRLSGLRYLLTLFGAIRRFRPRLAIDISLGGRYAFVLRILGVRQLAGFNYKGRGRFLSIALPINGYHREHVIRYTRRLLAFIGIRLLDERSEMHLSDELEAWATEWLRARGLRQGQPLIGLIPAGGASWGSMASYRRWNYEGFARVADHLIERYGAKVLCFGEPADRPACDEVAGHMRHALVDICGETSLEQFIALLGRLDLLVCNDGGPLHLAVARGVKTVSLFGPVDPFVYGPHPLQPGSHAVVFREDLPCRPCYHRFRLPPCPYERACLTTIEPEAVIRACEEMLDHRAQVETAGGGHV